MGLSGIRLFPAFIILTMLQYRKTAPILVTRVDEKTLSCLSRYKHVVKHAGQSRKTWGVCYDMCLFTSDWDLFHCRRRLKNAQKRVRRNKRLVNQHNTACRKGCKAYFWLEQSKHWLHYTASYSGIYMYIEAEGKTIILELSPHHLYHYKGRQPIMRAYKPRNFVLQGQQRWFVGFPVMPHCFIQ